VETTEYCIAIAFMNSSASNSTQIDLLKLLLFFITFSNYYYQYYFVCLFVCLLPNGTTSLFRLLVLGIVENINRWDMLKRFEPNELLKKAIWDWQVKHIGQIVKLIF